MSASPAQQYCLRWNNYQNNLTNVFDQLLQSESFVDVTLACDGHSVKAHKMVLSACSPYFQTLFFDNPCKHPIVILKDVKWDEIKAIVEFMYKGEINVSQEQLAPLLKVAEVLKIRGLADVNRGNASEFVSASSGTPNPYPANGTPSKTGGNSPNNNNNESDRESPIPLSHQHHHLRHPVQYSIMGNHRNGHLLASLKRKRRKLSTERSPSPPDTIDDHSNQLEIDSTNGDYPDNDSPIALIDPPGIGIGASGSLNSSPGINLPPGVINHGPPSSNSINSIGSSLLSLQNAAAAAAAVAVAGTSSSTLNDLDLKPGIVEMIREEERAKMLESSQAAGWLGGPSPGSTATLSDSYQYQIQSLWQKCWNTNQSGLHALRFRERGPLKSWRPETMAEAIFAVLREGLSLSQAARKFDIPYPTFVLYANRVHNMLGPSSDGASGGDLLSDMRPKGRGRPQRILLGTWPEDHIRGVIRAVVFRDGGKDDLSSFVFNREGLCGPMPPGGSSQNGLDMSLQPPFNMNPFIGIHHSYQSSNSTSPTNPLNANEPSKRLSSSPIDNDLGTSRSPKSIDKNSGTLISSLPGSGSQLLLSSSRTVSVPDRETLLIMQMGKNKFNHESHKNLLQIKSEIPYDDEEEDEDDDHNMIGNEAEEANNKHDFNSGDDENDEPNNYVRSSRHHENNRPKSSEVLRKPSVISDTTNSDGDLIMTPHIRSTSADCILQHEKQKDGDVNTPSPKFQT